VGERFARLLPKQLRRKRSGKVGGRWYVNETYLKVKGNGGYLYRAIDRSGDLVDSKFVSLAKQRPQFIIRVQALQASFHAR
jgi:transposase-like protein